GMSEAERPPTPEERLAEAKARIGQVLAGKWTLDELLGLGGVAAVYAATHEIGRREAIKLIHPELASDADLVTRFKREARIVKPKGTLVTERGAMLGTVAYMAPEQIRGDEVDGRADLFSLGATLFRVLAGRRPFVAADEAELARMMLKQRAPELKTVAPKV